MMGGKSFMDIVEQFASRMEWMFHDLPVDDCHDELFRESLFVLWKAYRTYDAKQESFDRYALSEVRQVLDEIQCRHKESERNASAIYLHRCNCDSTLYEAVTFNRILDKLTVNRWKWLHCTILWGRGTMKADSDVPIDVQEKLNETNQGKKDDADEQLEA